jgi:Flp pilus assembly protein TadD
MKSRRLGRSPSDAVPPSPAASAAPGRGRRPNYWLLAGAAVVLAATGLAVFNWSRPTPSVSPPAPEVAVAPAALAPLSPSPYHNTRPGVGYVGDARCLHCHADYAGYHDHPMGRSLFRAEDAPALERYAPGEAFRSGPYRFEATREGGKPVHREWCEDAAGKVVAEVRTEVAYAVGSGSQGRTFLYRRGDFLFESPMTWYSQKGTWDLSPGYESRPVHFTRRIDARCLFCHSHEVRPVENTVNRYADPPFGQLAIGCERCHGPGALHSDPVRPEVPKGETDFTIVNPRRLPPALRDAVCEQCHLQGEGVIPRRGRSLFEYRPGLPLHEYAVAFVRPPELDEATKIVGHAEQMRQSACYQKSNGRLGCATCHDPHRAPPTGAEALRHYESKCRDCHAAVPGAKADAPDCALPPAKRVLPPDGRTDCLACHMPRNPSATNQHLAVTDHRLLRRPVQVRQFRSEFRPGGVPLVPFHRHLLPPDDPDLPRDLALAAVDLGGRARTDGARGVADFLMRQALPPLERAARRDPTDVPALEARGFALLDQKRPEEALKWLEAALALAPDREQAMSWAAEAALALGRADRAESYCRRLAETNPHHAIYSERLAFLLARRGAWPESLAAARAAVRGNPFRPETREVLIAALLATGDAAGARVEFDAVGAIDPAYQAKLRERFGNRIPGAK